MSLTSSDGVTRLLLKESWTVDNTFFKMYVSGVAYDRPPVEGDEVRATFRFRARFIMIFKLLSSTLSLLINKTWTYNQYHK